MSNAALPEIQELERQVCALYGRLHDGALADSDLWPESEVEFADFSGAIDHYYNSREEFEGTFGQFASSYAPFSMFTDGELVLDVGADWGYSVIAMRYMGCAADVFSLDAAPFHKSALDHLTQLELGKYRWKNIAVSNDAKSLILYTPVLDGQPITGLTSSGGTLTAAFANIVTDFATKYGRDLTQRKGQPSRFGLYRFSTETSSLDLLRDKGEFGTKRIAAIKMDIEGHEGTALAGATNLLRDQKPLLMIEGANRNPEVSSIMSSLGYFHCELHDGLLDEKPEISMDLNGYWIHPDSADRYRSCGRLKD